MAALLLGSSCAQSPGAIGPEPADGGVGAPDGDTGQTLRIFALSSLAGALAPCGCTAHQLGGIDHAAAVLSNERTAAPDAVVLAAGPLWFVDPVRNEARAVQDEWKADTLARSLRELQLAAWTPGFNDWAAGPDLLAKLTDASGAPLLSANLSGAPNLGVTHVVRQAANVRVGLIGVSAPLFLGAAPAGVLLGDLVSAARSAMQNAVAEGAELLVLVASLDRGEALRLVEQLPELHLVVVGKAVDAGEANDVASPPVLVGNTLVVQSANHLQSIAIVDFVVRGGSFRFEDGSGIENAEKIDIAVNQMRTLEQRIADWEKDPTVAPSDLQARRDDLAALQAQLAALQAPKPAPAGSHFRYALAQVVDSAGTNETVAALVRNYDRAINEHNRAAFADRKAPPAAPGAGYMGVEACAPTCHAAPYAVWKNSSHPLAYASLVNQSREYDLECVGCHVTAYEQPGGSTVSDNARLQAVQCENCHGPGEAHAANPNQQGLTQRPALDLCSRMCHRPPHVEAFNAVEKRKFIVGPGHGMAASP